MEGAIGVHPLSLKGFRERKAMQGGRHIPMCPIFDGIPSVSYVVDVVQKCAHAKWQQPTVSR